MQIIWGHFEGRKFQSNGFLLLCHFDDEDLGLQKHLVIFKMVSANVSNLLLAVLTHRQ